MKHICYFYREQLDSKYIDKLVKDCLKLDIQDAKVVARSHSKVRRSKTAFLDKGIFSEIHKIVYDLAVDANNQAFGFDINDIDKLQFTLYEEANLGYYGWHADTNWISEDCCSRKISMSIQLSNPSDYEGGDVEIVDSNLTDEQIIDCKKKGSIITFPSFMQHRVTPVTKGRRMSLVGWVSGPKFR